MYEYSVFVIYKAEMHKKMPFFLGENREWTARAAEPIDQKQIHLPAGKIWVGETKWVMLPHARLTTTEVP